VVSTKSNGGCVCKAYGPGPDVDDQLTEILRNGERALSVQTAETGMADFLGKHAGLKTAESHRRVACHDHLSVARLGQGICRAL